MSAQTLAAIQAKRVAFLKSSRPLDIPTEQPLVTVEAVEGSDGDLAVKGGLAPPATIADVIRITALWKDSEVYVAPAREKLSRGER